MDSQLTHVASSLRPYLINKVTGTLSVWARELLQSVGGSEREREWEGHYYILLKHSNVIQPQVRTLKVQPSVRPRVCIVAHYVYKSV